MCVRLFLPFPLKLRATEPLKNGDQIGDARRGCV